MTLALSDMAKKWFKDLGSVEIEKLEYRCGFAFIGIWGKKLPNESRAENKFDQVQVSQVFLVNEEEIEKTYVREGMAPIMKKGTIQST